MYILDMSPVPLNNYWSQHFAQNIIFQTVLHNRGKPTVAIYVMRRSVFWSYILYPWPSRFWIILLDSAAVEQLFTIANDDRLRRRCYWEFDNHLEPRNNLTSDNFKTSIISQIDDSPNFYRTHVILGIQPVYVDTSWSNISAHDNNSQNELYNPEN